MGTSLACTPASATRTASNPGTLFFSEPRSAWRYCLRQANTWLAFTPCARATRATDAPGARVSSTIWRFSSGLRCRLLAWVGDLREDTLSITAGLEVSIYSPSGHPGSVHLRECPLILDSSRRSRPYAYIQTVFDQPSEKGVYSSPAG